MLQNKWEAERKATGIVSTHPRYHDIMLASYKSAASNSLNVDMRGWSWLNEVDAMFAFMNKHEIFERVQECVVCTSNHSNSVVVDAGGSNEVVW